MVQQHSIVAASALTKRLVKSRSGENLGEIIELMVDIEKGQIVYAVFTFYGGCSEIGRQYFAVPWKSLELDSENDNYVLHIEAKRLPETDRFDSLLYTPQSSSFS